ncbi:hypothetical protein [Candidatus Colwellia aromaticivorans]|uniref:hypothetical protein n=1 Tax=Candidatus Colwellia aromaticivorans TaxID=2267621 RepID=UPI000DF117CF|nr:hypothetical protein [Candidatus Colwellia aromaticivorans]
MLSSNPLTASIDIQRTTSTFKQLAKVTNETENKTKLGEFADDILNISTIGHQKQRTEAQLQANQKINDIANDVIRVSSSIGKARTLGNLTNSQATNLYNKISALL